MRLIDKITLWYLAIAIAVLALGALIIFHNFKEEIDKEQVRELKEWMNEIAVNIEQGQAISNFTKGSVDIRQIDTAIPIQELRVRDTLAMHSQLQRMERHLKASKSYKINDKHYLISIYNIMVETDDITDAVKKSISRIFLLFLLLVVATGRIISSLLLRPFHKTIKVIQSFDIRKKEKMILPDSTTSEFRKLKKFLEEMSEKAVSDYSSLKQFAENASHEIQTPIAVARGKMELLMNSNINDEQAKMILPAYEALEKLTRLGQSLTLSTKLENQEFKANETINLSKVIEEILGNFEEMIAMKSIVLKIDLEPDVQILIHPMLAESLLTNLITNAIKHNIQQGSIEINLNKKRLIISNTGTKLEIPPELLLERFRKGKQNNDSMGLGLSIVKQICEQQNFRIKYTNTDKWHTIEIIFS